MYKPRCDRLCTRICFKFFGGVFLPKIGKIWWHLSYHKHIKGDVFLWHCVHWWLEPRCLLSDRSQSCAGSNRPSSQLTVWTCSQTSGGHTCPPSLAVPHRSVTRLPSRPRVGGDVQAALGTDGLTQLLLTSGDEPSCMVTRGWHHGPPRLHVNNNDDVAAARTVLGTVCPQHVTSAPSMSVSEVTSGSRLSSSNVPCHDVLQLL